MRNLVVLGERRRSVPIDCDQQSPHDGTSTNKTTTFRGLCSFQSECGAESATVVMTAEGVLVRVNNEGETVWVCRLDELCPGGNWFDLTHVDSIDALVCLSRSGGIVTVSPTTGKAELVGEFDYGIEAGGWSPDGEVLLLVTFSENEDDANEKNSILLTMNGQWEVLSEVPIETHVSSVDKNQDDLKVSLCWQPDGTACAVSSVDAHDEKRRIRTYERETLALKSIGRSEDGSGKLVPGLIGESGVAWASGGCSNLLTAVQRKSKRTQQVVFFEPNGLRHREFVLRHDETTDTPMQSQPRGLSWNVESDLLAVTLREPKSDKVQLWHRSNYHWYLKQEVRFAEESRVVRAMFHNEQPYTLLILLDGGNTAANTDSELGVVEWRELEFCWDPSTVAVSTPQSNSCTAAVVDGCLLNITPLEKALVPPPMFASSLTMDCPIRGISFVPTHHPSLFSLLQLSDGNMVCVGNGGGEKSCMIANYIAPSVVAKIRWKDIGDSIDILALRNFVVLGGEINDLRLVALHSPPRNTLCEQLVEIDVVLNDDGFGIASVTNVIMLEGRVLRMIPWSDSSPGALLHFDDGSLFEYEQSRSLVHSDIGALLEPCPWLAAMRMSSGDDHQRDETLVVGLSSRSRLFCHDRLLADSVSSFVLSPTHGFLCYATAGSHCQLRFLPISELLTFDPLMGSDENRLLDGYEPRNVERGSRLVAILPTQPTAILQLPRGNMEGIYPRALVLPFVMSKIDKGEYGVAFEMMRRQRVDLNLIVDMNPSHFLDVGVNIFLKQVRDIDYLNLFIATLQDLNVTEWKYKIPEWFRTVTESSQDGFDYTTKVNRVCGVLRALMIQSEEGEPESNEASVSKHHFLLPILSTFAKEKPPKLEEALSLIKENAVAAQSLPSKKPPLFSERAQSSIQYLAFLADYELLFSTALGMYDYELARAVARNSQMDPKVYLPLLKRLKLLDTFYGRYEVDVRLKRYEKALSNLFQSGVNEERLESAVVTDNDIEGNAFEHCLSFIEEHKLHRLGLELYRNQAEKRHCITLALAERLMRESESEAALAVFLAAEPPDLDGAKRAARACGDWKVFFSLTMDNTKSGDEESIAIRRRSIASDIAEEISAGKGGKYSRQEGLIQAGKILLDYGKDVAGAIDMFIAAEQWIEARRIACLYSRQDLEKKCIDGAVSFGHTLLDEFEDRGTAFVKAHERYEECLRIRREAARNFDLEHGESNNSDVGDSGSLFSVATNESNMSLRSNMSGSSVGSVSSVSSVISIGATSSFSITSDRDVNKHKSKFNKIGRSKKTKKKKRGGKKMQLGSEEELKSLVGTLKVNNIAKEFRDGIAETIQFLVHVGKSSLAREVYNGYNSLKDTIESSQHHRMQRAKRQRDDAERKARKEGNHHEHIVLPIEAEVDALQCEEMPKVLQHFFSFMSTD